MRLSDISIKNPVFAWMLMFAMMIFGLISFSRMGLSQLPDVDFPTVTVSVSMDGAAPEVMETQVVDPIESALMAVEGVQNITSSSKSGIATITVEFDLDRNIDVALQDVQARVAAVQKLLPKEMDPPTMSKTNPDDSPIMMLAVTYDGDPLFLAQYVRDFLKDRFSTVAGVGDITLAGYTDPVMEVTVRPKDLKKHNLAIGDIINAITKGQSEIPGGFVETDKKSFNVRTMGEAHTVDEFRSLIIGTRGGQVIQDPTNQLKINQVADANFGLYEVRRFARFNEKPALGIGIRKQRGSNAVAVARAVKDKIQELSPFLPKGMQVHVNFDSTKFIEDSVHKLTHELIMAVLLTSIVCWIFLGSFSATFNVLMSIPTSLLGAFIGLYAFGYTLNTFTLLGLTLAIGIVVDDAIMVLENIFRYNEQGRGPIESAIVGSREITFAAMAASVAVIAIFLPVAFMKGIIGKFFMQFGVTISIAVFLSLVESLTITPMRCASFVHHGERTTKIGKAFEAFMELLRVRYDGLLQKTLQYRWTVVIGSLIFLAVSFASINFIGKEMTPTQDQSVFIGRIMMPVGTALSYTNQQAQQIEAWLHKQPEVKQVYAAIGGFGSGTMKSSSDANQAMVYVSLKDYDDRPVNPQFGHRLSQAEFMQVARKFMKSVKDVRPILMDLSQRGFSNGKGYPIEFTIVGNDWDKLAEYSQQITTEMEKSGLMTDIDTDYLLGMPEIQVRPNRSASAQHGIDIQSIGSTINSLIGGVKVGEYPQGGHRYDIRVKLAEEGNPLEQINTLMIGNARGNLISLPKVSSQNTNPSLQQISRRNRQRAITITANLKAGASQQEAMGRVQKLASQILAPGYMINESGNAKSFKESFQSLIFALILGLVIAYMVLASQFNSFIDPVAILMALPFSFSGAFFALLLTGQTLNMYSMIGLLLLMGIVKKNSILLIEFTNTVRDQNNGTAIESLIKACPIRLRPIIMTSVATIAAAIPSAMAGGAGSETMRPMAITLIGGVLVSTILTLFVVPCIYSLLDPLRKRTEIREKTKRAFDAVGDEALG
ncbi:MAG: efflux RND transporter permease subunit [Bacillota bacterium]